MLILLNSCMFQNSERKYSKCKYRCYDAYQLAIQPCLNTLENVECKAVYEKDLVNCLQNCEYAERQRSRDRRETQRQTVNQILYPDRNSQ
jgi:hypothetical protein